MHRASVMRGWRHLLLAQLLLRTHAREGERQSFEAKPSVVRANGKSRPLTEEEQRQRCPELHASYVADVRGAPIADNGIAVCPLFDCSAACATVVHFVQRLLSEWSAQQLDCCMPRLHVLVGCENAPMVHFENALAASPTCGEHFQRLPKDGSTKSLAVMVFKEPMRFRSHFMRDLILPERGVMYITDTLFGCPSVARAMLQRPNRPYMRAVKAPLLMRADGVGPLTSLINQLFVPLAVLAWPARLLTSEALTQRSLPSPPLVRTQSHAETDAVTERGTGCTLLSAFQTKVNPRAESPRRMYTGREWRGRLAYQLGCTIPATNDRDAPRSPWVLTSLGGASKHYRSRRFAIAVENSMEPGYVSEKIVNALLAGAVPIVRGGGSFHRIIFAPEAFVDCSGEGGDRDNRSLVEHGYSWQSLDACADLVRAVNRSISGGTGKRPPNFRDRVAVSNFFAYDGTMRGTLAHLRLFTSLTMLLREQGIETCLRRRRRQGSLEDAKRQLMRAIEGNRSNALPINFSRRWTERCVEPEQSRRATAARFFLPPPKSPPPWENAILALFVALFGLVVFWAIVDVFECCSGCQCTSLRRETSE